MDDPLRRRGPAGQRQAGVDRALCRIASYADLGREARRQRVSDLQPTAPGDEAKPRLSLSLLCLLGGVAQGDGVLAPRR